MPREREPSLADQLLHDREARNPICSVSAIWVTCGRCARHLEDPVDHRLEVLVRAGDHGSGGRRDWQEWARSPRDVGQVIDHVGQPTPGDLEGDEGEDLVPQRLEVEVGIEPGDDATSPQLVEAAGYRSSRHPEPPSGSITPARGVWARAVISLASSSSIPVGNMSRTASIAA